MLKAKAILVMGETKTYNGAQVRDLGTKVEKALDEFLKTVDPESIVSIKVNTQYMGISGDQAFILILYKTSGEAKKQEVEVEKEVVIQKPSRRLGK